MKQIQQNTQYESFQYQLNDKSGYFDVRLQNNKVCLMFFKGGSLIYSITYELDSQEIGINKLSQQFWRCTTLMEFLQLLAKKTESKQISLGGKESIRQIRELYDYYYDTHKKDDKEQEQNIENNINTKEPQNKNTLYENYNENEKEILNTILEVDEEKEENDKDIKRIHAEIKIKDDKVVVSFYEPFKDGVWLFKKGSNVHQKVSKKKVKEVELDIKLSQEGKGMELKVGKISTFDLVNSETFKNEYEYKITEHNDMMNNYKYLLNNNDTLDIGSDKDIKILNFLFSSCKDQVEKKDDGVEDKVHNGIPKGEVLALYNALVKTIEKCFSFKANINKDNTNKYLSIELPYNKGQFLITINPAKKEMTYNNQTYPYTDDKSMRQLMKKNLYRECLNDNFEEYMKTIWNEKIEKFVNELDLSQILMRESKNTDLIESLSQNPCVRALCCIYD